MAISKIRWNADQGGAWLEFELDGEPAAADFMQGAFHATGYVVLSPASVWESRLPEVEIPPNPERGSSGLTLRGATNDPEVVAAFRDFRQAVIEGRDEQGPQS